MRRKKEIARKFRPEETAAFCGQAALLLNAGIPFYEGIHMIYSEAEVGTKEILKEIAEDVAENVPIHKALGKSKVFPEYMIHMVKVGESSGKLEEVFRLLSAYYEREAAVKADIRSAVAYPMALFAMAAVILFLMVLKVLPMFEQMFDELSRETSAAVNQSLSIGITGGRVAAGACAVLLVLAAGLLIWYGTKSGKKALGGFFRSFPLTRRYANMIAVGKFLSGMALMAASGMQPEESLEIMEETIDHPVMNKKIGECRRQCSENTALEEALKNTGIVAGMEGRMLIIAAKSGAFDSVLENLSRSYDEKTTKLLGRLASTIETVLVITLSVVVGAVLLAVMIPLAGMISSIG